MMSGEKLGFISFNPTGLYADVAITDKKKPQRRIVEV